MDFIKRNKIWKKCKILYIYNVFGYLLNENLDFFFNKLWLKKNVLDFVFFDLLFWKIIFLK